MPELKEIELTKVKLTPKQRMFLKELIATLSPTEAAMRSYNCKDRLSARVIASENLSKLNITMNDLMDKMGLTVEEDIEDLKRLRRAKRLHVCDIYIKDDNGKLKINKNSNDFIEVDDNTTQLKALELTLKLKGHLKEKDRGNVIQQTFVGADIVEKIKKLEVTQVRTQVKTEV